MCGSFRIKKNGHQRSRQLYKCCTCGHQFLRSYRRQELPGWVTRAYEDYASGKQTYTELCDRYGRDPKTLRRYFDRCEPTCGELHPEEEPVNLVLDATFFQRGDGLLVCRTNGRNLYWREIMTERVEDYATCLDVLEATGARFLSFTIDGRRGVRQMLQARYPCTPIQYCQYHQIQTITQKLTSRPKLPAGKELRALALTLTQTTREDFTIALDQWHERWGEFLRERTYSEERKRRWRYTHERLRSASFSLRRNLPWLFTHLDHPELYIPNTTNSCEGSFSHWKRKVQMHRSIRRQRRKKMVNYLLERS